MIVYPDNQGAPLATFTSLYEIARRDTQLGEEPVADAVALSQILYTAPTDLDGFGRPFMAKLTSTSAIIYVLSVGGDFVLDDGTPISEVWGITIPDGTILLGDEELPAIVIYYDYTNGNGEGYAVVDEDDQEICLPAYVLLGHELSHASHIIDGDHPEDLTEAHETIIIPEENLIRDEHGLPHRNPANDSGTTPSLLCASPVGDGGPSACFVLTAALGMERHDPIAALHALRRRLLGPTRLGAAFYAALRREYHAFAPTLADEVRREVGLRQAVRDVVIEPFLGWAAVVDRYLTPAREGRATWPTTRAQHDLEAAAALGGLVDRLRGRPRADRADLDELTEFLAARIASGCGRAPLVAWAIFEPARLWLTWPTPLDDAIEAWLGAMPIPDQFYSLTPNALTDELEVVARHGLFTGLAGRTLASRIRAGFRRRGRPDLSERIALQTAGDEGGRSWRG